MKTSTKPQPLRVYLAGPEVFLPNAIQVLERKKQLCARYGFEGIHPFDLEANVTRLPKREAGIQIGQNNETLIRSCGILIANLTPFRGPSADVGTVYECGFARALGLVIFGYTHTTRPYFARTIASLKDTIRQDKTGQPRDANRMVIEDFDLPDNLMIPSGIESSGGQLIAAPIPQSKWYTNLSTFELCLQAANLARSTPARRPWEGQAPARP